MRKETMVRPGGGSIAVRRGERPITLLALQERRVVVLLRGACHEGLDGIVRAEGTPPPSFSSSLARLAENVRDCALILFGPQSRFVSDDELAILSWLSMLQRPSQSARWRMANPLQEALRAFAEALLREDRRLPARSMLADARLEREDCFHIELEPESPQAGSRRARTMPGTESAAARAVALVERRRFATASQFRALGISTQKLSRLCRRGYIERVSLGLYKKPGANDVMLTS